MKRVAIDTQIVDRILDTAGVLEEINAAAKRCALVVISNHVVRDELEATPEPDRRERLLRVYDALQRKDVLTRGGIYGVSKYGMARYGDGSETGISLSEARTQGRGRSRDALIATTAAGEADVLVTEDQTLAKRVRTSKAKCKVWSFSEFLSFVRTDGREETVTQLI